jgi:hypothetical protein
MLLYVFCRLRYRVHLSFPVFTVFARGFFFLGFRFYGVRGQGGRVWIREPYTRGPVWPVRLRAPNTNRSAIRRRATEKWPRSHKRKTFRHTSVKTSGPPFEASQVNPTHTRYEFHQSCSLPSSVEEAISSEHIRIRAMSTTNAHREYWGSCTHPSNMCSRALHLNTPEICAPDTTADALKRI